MKIKLINVRAIFFAWTPILAFLIAFCLRSTFTSYWCLPINSGGKELVCGLDYAHPVMQFIFFVLKGLSECSILITIVLAFQRRLSKFGTVGLIFSVLLVVTYFILKAYFRAEDSP